MTVLLSVTPVYRISKSVAIVIVLWQHQCWVQHCDMEHCDMGKISLFKL